MLLLEHLNGLANRERWTIRIFATDIDLQVTPSERDPAVDKELEHSLSRAVKGAVANHTDSFW